MGSNERREREKQETRKRILDAARELFAEHGFDAVTMRKIADRIEYTPTALYFHFKDKDTLIRELCVTDFEAFGEHFAALAGEQDPVERLRKTGRAYADFAIAHPQHYRVMFMSPEAPEATDVDWRGNPAKDAYAFLRWTMTECIEQGRLRDPFNEPELASQIAWGTIHGVVSLHITHCKGKWIEWRTIEDRVNGAIEALVHGMVAPEARGAKGPAKKKDG